MLQPNSQGHRSYFEAFQRKNNVAVDVLRRENALTDRSAYLNFLEIQLERVSAACLASQDFGNRIDEFAARAAAGEEKVLSATKLIRLAQTYSEEQGREQARINEALEVRLAGLEQHVDDVSIAVEDAAAARSQLDAVGAGNSNQNPGCSSDLCGINTAGLSEWMTSVDKQLEDLRASLLSRSPGKKRDDLDPPGVTGDVSSPPKEDNLKATEAVESAVKATAEVIARDECAKMEERLRSLEAALEVTKKDRTETGGSGGGNPELSSESATERDRGRRLERCAELARDGLSRSRSRSPTRSPNPSPPPPPLPLVAATAVITQPGVSDAGNNTERNSDVVLHAVEDGTAVARRASEMAQEALEAGQQAVERSVRAEKLAKTLAVRSFKLAKEQHGEVTSALDRLNEKVLRTEDRVDCRQRSAGGAYGNRDEPAGSAKRKLTLQGGSAARSRQGRSQRAVGTSVPGETWPAKESGRAGGGRGVAGPRSRVRARVRSARHGAEEAHETTSPRAFRAGRGSSPGYHRVTPRDTGGDTKSHRSVREIREILENSAFADSDNGRRIALAAARTALESILREASPAPQDRGREDVEEGGGEGCRWGTMDSSSRDFRKVDELREAIRGAVNILSGISDGSHLQEEGVGQRSSSRCSRRGTNPCSRLSRSQERSTTPPRGSGDGKRHAEGYWVPPGSIPSKVGERTIGGRTRACATREVPEDEEEEEGRRELAASSR